jgi:sugar lactone lactonase YvrE
MDQQTIPSEMGWLVASKIITIFVFAILVLPASNVFAFSNGQAATVVLGQSSFTTSTSGTTATTLHEPIGISFDSGGNLWVADTNNNRVLEYATPITTGEAATIVVGQGSLTTITPGTTATTLLFPDSISFDSAGNLWVVDSSNNRVLEYATPITTGEAATVVIGQGTFTTGTVGTTATSLSAPIGISFDSAGNLWVADRANNRVLEYATPITTGEAATVVIGQGTFTTGTADTTATTLNSPTGVSLDSAGNLWVVDDGNNRVLKYTAPITTGEAATVVIGQGTFTTGTADTTSATLTFPRTSAFDSAGNLWVADDGNSRVLKYATPITTGERATLVIGHGTFTQNAAGTTATTLNLPFGISLDSAGSLWVADAGNNRVLKYPSTISQVTGQLTVAGTCGINVVSGAPINYGSLTPGSISTEQTVVLQNTGTVSGTLAVHGTDWIDVGSTSQILVGNTKFSPTTGTYASKTSLTATDVTVGTINPTPNLSTFWQAQVNLITSTFSGSLTQTVTFSNSC